MTIIYVVTRGQYSDYSIEAIFSTQENAEAFLALGGRGESGIEEWEVDPNIDGIRQGRQRWCVILSTQGEFMYGFAAGVEQGEEPRVNGLGNFVCYVTAKDEQGAIKVAHDK